MATQRNPDVKQLIVMGRDEQGNGASRVMYFDTKDKDQEALYNSLQEELYSNRVSENVVNTFEQALITEIDYKTADLALFYQKQEDRAQRPHDEREFSTCVLANSIGEEVEVNEHNFHKAFNEVTDLSYDDEEISRNVINVAYKAALDAYDLEQNKGQPVQEQQQEFALER